MPVLVTQLRRTLCNLTDCTPPGSSVHGIFQAILDWVAMPSSRDLPYPEIQPVHPKGNQSWIFIGRTDVEAETPILWPPDAKNGLTGKDPDAGKDWRQEEKGTTEDEVVGWHHRLNTHEFEQASGDGDGQRGPACCSPWGRNKSDMTEQLNWTESRGSQPLGSTAWWSVVELM